MLGFYIFLASGRRVLGGECTVGGLLTGAMNDTADQSIAQAPLSQVCTFSVFLFGAELTTKVKASTHKRHAKDTQVHHTHNTYTKRVSGEGFSPSYQGFHRFLTLNVHIFSVELLQTF